uniref:Uncharacterized protein n=1 Tax=Periophthalmus magnuspinnatus TaxID=409849 RepID=A0A3B3ZWR5_9GOBI
MDHRAVCCPLNLNLFTCTSECDIFTLRDVITNISCLCRFFISAPNVFHEGVKEKVFVQLGKNHLNKNLRIYLEHESLGIVLSDTVTVTCTKEEKGELTELMIDQKKLSTLSPRPSYVMLVAEGLSVDRKMTRVLLSPHRGHIFIQTDQPLYKPMDTVKFRIFTLDHTFRPSEEVFHLLLYNALGNRALKAIYTTKGGLFENHFVIPDVAKTGIWRIVAHYEGDRDHAVSKEFKVQKFVMPSFEVNVQMENNYILVNTKEENINFRILARYTHANPVNGAYHCQFGVIPKGSSAKPTLIKGMEQTGSINDGTASVSVNIAKLNQKTQEQTNLSLSELEGRGELLYLGVLVTDVQNGEIQERQMFIPVVSHKYRIDLSRTVSHFKPGFPLNVALVRLPDGSPAEKVPVTMTLMDQTGQSTTNLQGAVFYTFNVVSTNAVSVDDSSESKVINAAVSPVDLHLDVLHKEYTVGDELQVKFMTKNAPQTGVIHYLVLSQGSIVDTNHVNMRDAITQTPLKLQISDNMVPSFRIIGYFYTPNNHIISDSVWLVAKGNCEEKVKVEHKATVEPRRLSKLDIDLFGQEATVALLAVDTAFNSLNADNKLTQEQVYSSMEAYDLGCSYGGGQDPGSVMEEAGLVQVFQTKYRYLKCHSKVRQKRSVDLEQEMMELKSKYEEEILQSCCAHGFLLIPMQWSCEERVKRVFELQGNTSCTWAFRDCCLEGQRLREQRAKEEAKKGLGRTTSLLDIEEHFLTTDNAFIRKVFSSSFAFTSFPVKGKASFRLGLPDSITTWEIRVVTLSKASGLCVKKPSLLRAFKPVFVSLRLPTSVRKYEEMFIAPVIYNYDSADLHVAVHMAQSEGLCSPGSATSVSFVNVTVSPDSSQTVTFSAVPMRSGSIPIQIRLYDINKESELDAIEKILNVWTEGVEKTEEETTIIHLNGWKINGKLPDDTVPESTSNIFISVEEDGFSKSRLKNLLNPEKVAKLIHLPSGCLEQTTRTLTQTAVAVRYLDLSDQWFSMPPGSRDEIKYSTLFLIYFSGVARIVQLLTQSRSPGAYGSWPNHRPSTWLTSHVVKVLSMVGKRQLFTFDREGRKKINTPVQQIIEGVRYLSAKQEADGSFSDANRVLHRGILNGVDSKAFMTSFATLALTQSLDLLNEQEKSSTLVVISKATEYLWSNFNQLQHPLAVAITAYSLAVSKEYAPEVRHKAAITVETTAYALLTAVALKEVQQANKLAHWLTTQENYYGGFYSSQDTLVALEALSEYEMMAPATSEANLEALFTAQGKNYVEKLQLDNKDKVEKDLKRFVGRDITATFKGSGKAIVKVRKVFHLMEPKDICDKVSIEVKVKGKVKYTVAIQENYEYYDDDNMGDDNRMSRTAIEWIDIRTRRRRDVDSDQADDHFVTYEVCVMHNPTYELTGMSIVDLTLLSGFVAEAEDLEALKAPPEQYISHYELSHGKVLIYLNQLVEQKQCFEFDAKQLHTVGLLQPAPAVFYDYYEPGHKCTVFYSAPKRSKVISRLCSGDVCQCAESLRPPKSRLLLSCSLAYMVTVMEASEKNNFVLYKTKVTDVLKINGDHVVKTGSHRVFAKRRQCKSRLEEGMEYLIMGKDGTTTDSHGQKQYLLEANTWVEPKPFDCDKTDHANFCIDFTNFVEDFKANSCRQ